MSHTCREFGSRGNVHELDCVPFCSLSSYVKCFCCIFLLSCAFGGKTTRLSDSLQAEQSHIFVEAKSVVLESFKKKNKIFLFFFSTKLF